MNRWVFSTEGTFLSQVRMLVPLVGFTILNLIYTHTHVLLDNSSAIYYYWVLIASSTMVGGCLNRFRQLGSKFVYWVPECGHVRRWTFKAFHCQTFVDLFFYLFFVAQSLVYDWAIQSEVLCMFISWTCVCVHLGESCYGTIIEWSIGYGLYWARQSQVPGLNSELRSHSRLS